MLLGQHSTTHRSVGWARRWGKTYGSDYIPVCLGTGLHAVGGDCGVVHGFEEVFELGGDGGEGLIGTLVVLDGGEVAAAEARVGALGRGRRGQDEAGEHVRVSAGARGEGVVDTGVESRESSGCTGAGTGPAGRATGPASADAVGVGVGVGGAGRGAEGARGGAQDMQGHARAGRHGGGDEEQDSGRRDGGHMSVIYEGGRHACWSSAGGWGSTASACRDELIGGLNEWRGGSVRGAEARGGCGQGADEGPVLFGARWREVASRLRAGGLDARAAAAAELSARVRHAGWERHPCGLHGVRGAHGAGAVPGAISSTHRAQRTGEAGSPGLQNGPRWTGCHAVFQCFSAATLSVLHVAGPGRAAPGWAGLGGAGGARADADADASCGRGYRRVLLHTPAAGRGLPHAALPPCPMRRPSDLQGSGLEVGGIGHRASGIGHRAGRTPVTCPGT